MRSLITSIIQSELKGGRFSLRAFYVRRLWRIQVALLAVVFATLLIALAFYLPDDLSSYFKSAIQTTVFSSNRYFARATTAYAATDSEVLLLLHTWSLSIEWQWYLILPVGLLLLHRYASPAWGRAIVLGLTMLMLGVALYLSDKEGSGVYYLFRPRVFEFLFGASLALWSAERPRLTNTCALNVVGVLALFLVIGMAMISGVSANYPNYYSVAVCGASVAMLWLGFNRDAWITRILSSRPLVFVGDLSYSLYLWHWPIFATGRYLGWQKGIAFLPACYLLTFACAYLSYRYIEEPYRRHRPSFRKSVLLLVFLPLLVISTGYAVAHKYKFFPSRFGSELAYIDGTLDAYVPLNRRFCLQGRSAKYKGLDPSLIERCRLGAAVAPKKALLIGDSYANQSWNFIDVMARDADMSVTALSTPSCLALPHITMEGWWKMRQEDYRICDARTGDYYKLVSEGRYTYVILVANWFYYDLDDIVNKVGDEKSAALGVSRLESAMREALDIMIGSEAVPVVLKSPASMPEDFQSCFYQQIKVRAPSKSGHCGLSNEHGPTEQQFDALFDRLKASYPTLIVIDPRRAQCDSETCRTDFEGVPVYRDTGHLSDYASYRLGEVYLQREPNPFKSM